MLSVNETILEHAAEQISNASAILIGAGAGMGVDSGLPDFRGDEGFWRAYPPYRHLGLSFVALANPAWFDRDPRLAWGFYGHRLQLYRRTEPHPGFQILRRWLARAGNGFVVTSNVDGQFQQAGFAVDRILECHGSLHHLQCITPCSDAIWSAETTVIAVEEQSFRAREPLPRCCHCGRLARPNVLMFGDDRWCTKRTAAQQTAFERWLATLADCQSVVIECGAGRAVPTVRHLCEWIAAHCKAALIRINPREPEGPANTLSIAAGALETLSAIDARLGN